MTVVLVLLVLGALLLVVIAAIGPRRWYWSVTRAIRPDAPEPSREGYGLLLWRNVVAAVLAVALVTPFAWDRLRFTEEELKEATDDAVARIGVVPGGGGPGEDQLVAQVELGTDRDVVADLVASVRPDDPDSSDPKRLYFEISTQPRGVRDGDPEVCVTYEVTDRIPGVEQSAPTLVRRGACPEATD